MLIFEYSRRISIEPTSLINDAPSIWRWTNPVVAIAEWMQTLYALGLDVDPSDTSVYSVAYAEEVPMTTVPDYATLQATVFSFYWDNINQTAYFHFDVINPHALSSMALSKLFGATDTVSRVYNGLLYPPILMSKPSITRAVEPVTYTRLATQSISIEMENDVLYKLVDNRPVKYWRFDDLLQAEELIAGQTTYLKYGDEDTLYDELIVLHKGVVTNCKVLDKSVKLTCDDKRSMSDVEWPINTYKSAGYTVDDVDESKIDSVIPDGYGLNKRMPMECINRSTTILAVDDDDNTVMPSDQLVPWDLSTWTKYDGADTTDRGDSTLAGFQSCRIAKTTGTSRIGTSFTATTTKHKIQGYFQIGNANVPVGDTVLSIFTFGTIDMNVGTRTYTASGVFSNVRVKFIQNGTDETLVFFGFEFSCTIGTSYSILFYPDDDVSQLTSAVIGAGFRVCSPVYPTFKVAEKISATGLKVFYDNDDETIEITNIVSIDEDNGTVSLYDVDAHVDGLLDGSLNTLLCTATLRPQVNPMDIIADLNYNLSGIPYISSLYNTALCETEKLKLSNVALYKNSKANLSSIIEELQAGSVVGFRYDDIDKIYIFCDDPNRPYTFNIPRGAVVNFGELEPEGNLTLYADEVTVNYSTDRSNSSSLNYTNSDYKKAVLTRYSYTKPTTVDSLLTNETDAINKSKVLLEDLSFTRPEVTIKVHGLDILKIVDLYHIGIVDLSLSKERTFLGTLRAQVIRIEIDTQFKFVTFTLRERVYSSVFADIVGEYADVVLIGDNESVLGSGESVLGVEGV